MKNRIMKLIAMGIISFSLIGNNIIAFATEPETEITEQIAEDEIIEYHEEITDIPTEEEKNEIVEEKTQEQEEKKQEIEDQNGTYDYAITVEIITLEKEVSEEVNSAAEANSLADETDGTIETEIINSTEGSSTVIVENEENIETAVEEIAATASASDTSTSDNIEREIVNVETEEVSGVSAELVDEKGYHIDENEDGSFTIVVTGGLDEIEIDFAWFSETELMYPGDEVNASFSIVNESGDKYEVTGYEKKTDGPYRYSLSTNFNEDWGTPVKTFTDSREREYTAYIPDEILKINGRDIDKATLEIMYKEYPDKNMWERRELAENLTEEELLAYYNEQMGTEYQDTFEAWEANLNERLWTTTYTKNGEEEQYGEDFWKSVDLTTNTPTDFTMTASLDGLGTDNLYQMTVWDFVELLKLKAIPNIAVTVDYVDNELKYIVNYTVEETSYTVEIDGEGSIPKIETEPTPESEIPINPEPTPDPEPEIPIVSEPEPEIPVIPDPKPEIPIDPEPEIPIVSEPEPVAPIIPEPEPIEPPVENPKPISPPIIVDEPDIPSIVPTLPEENNDEPEEYVYIPDEEVPLIEEIPQSETEVPINTVLGETRIPKNLDKQVLGAARMAETNDKNNLYKRDILICGCIFLIIFMTIIYIIEKKKKS